MADIGHNSGEVINGAAQTQLRSVIERLERLDTEKSEIAEQMKEVLAEAKGNGFDTKIIRRVLRERKVDRAKRAEADAIFDLYWHAIGEA